MPEYSENFAELRFGGSAWAGQETWSCGLKLRHIGGDALEPMFADTVSTIEDVAGVVEDYFTGDSGFSGGCLLEWVRLNVISAATGKYAFPNSPQIFEFEEPVSSGKNVGYPQIAYCVTLRGLPKRGPAARGRWFVPVAAAGPPVVTSTGVMPLQLAQPWANAAAVFLDALQGITSGEGPNTWSPYLYGFSETTGTADSPIALVQVGNVYDTQRRRRKSIVETYTNATNWP